MAITITKSKEVVKTEAPKADTLSDYEDLTKATDEKLADLYGSLEDQIAALRQSPVFTKFAQVQEELAKRLEGIDPTDVAKIKGQHWLLDIGMCSKSPRKLLPNAISTIQEMLGQETFAAIAKVTVADVEKYLTPDQVSKVLNEDTGYTKNRKIVAKYLG